MTQQITIGLLMYPGVQLSAVYGLMDLFCTANRISMEHRPQPVPPLSVSRWRLEPTSGAVEVLDGRTVPTQLTVVIIPPNLESQGTDEPNAAILDWLRAQHSGGAVVCSICTAAFVLARTGLLNGRPATTHWALQAVLSKQFPRIRVQTEKMLIEDGDIITAGGVTAWIDLGLKLIDRFLGPSVMLAVAQFFLIDPNGREQRFYSKFAPQFYHGDAAILRVQHWLQTHYSNAIAIADMTPVAVLGERTFLRRFKKATGMKPIEYLQTLRVSKAREMLEFSQTPFSEIAWNVGYEDQGAFRKVFVRLMGLSPGEYRRRFSVGTAAIDS